MTDKKYENTGSLFFNPKKILEQDGAIKTVFVDKANTATVSFTSANDMAYRPVGGGDTELVPAQSNDYGRYWPCRIAGQLYFFAQKVNKKDGTDFVMAKKAQDRNIEERTSTISAAYGTRA